MTPDEARDDRARELLARADMRIQIVQREVNQGALAGLGSEISEHAAALVVAALDTYDEHAAAEIERRARERAAVELEARFQRMREDGEHDMRTALDHVREVLRGES